MSVATAVFRSSELECAGDDSIFFYLWCVSFYVGSFGCWRRPDDLLCQFCSFWHYLWSTTGLISRLDWRAFCFDQQRPVTLGLAYDRAIYTIYFDRTASSKFLGFNGLKGLKSGVKLESHTTQRAPNEQIHNSRWAREMHPV